MREKNEIQKRSRDEKAYCFNLGAVEAERKKAWAFGVDVGNIGEADTMNLNEKKKTASEAWGDSLPTVISWCFFGWVLVSLYWAAVLNSMGAMITVLVLGGIGIFVHFGAYLLVGLPLYYLFWRRSPMIWNPMVGVPLGGVLGSLVGLFFVVWDGQLERDEWYAGVVTGLYGAVTGFAACLSARKRGKRIWVMGHRDLQAFVREREGGEVAEIDDRPEIVGGMEAWKRSTLLVLSVPMMGLFLGWMGSIVLGFEQAKLYRLFGLSFVFLGPHFLVWLMVGVVGYRAYWLKRRDLWSWETGIILGLGVGAVLGVLGWGVIGDWVWPLDGMGKWALMGGFYGLLTGVGAVTASRDLRNG